VQDSPRSLSDEEEDAEHPVNKAPGLTIPKYDDQLRIIREAIVELRSTLNAMRSKANDAIFLPGHTAVSRADQLSDLQASGAGESADSPENAVRLLRAALQAHVDDADRSIAQLRKELYTYMARSVQERGPRRADPDKPQPVGRPHALDSSHRLTPPSRRTSGTPTRPDYAEPSSPHRDLHPPDSLPPEPDSPPASPKLVDDVPVGPINKPPPSVVPPQPTPGLVPAPTPWLRPAPAPAPVPGPVSESVETAPARRPGPQPHVVRQEIDDIHVINATPEQQAVLDAIVPVFRLMQAQMTSVIEAACDHAHRAEVIATGKVDKDFVNDFFQKIRLRMIEIHKQVDGLKQQLPERVTREELKDYATEIFQSVSRETSATAGRVSYNCLFCGQQRSQVSGMITDPTVADALGEPPKTRVGGRTGTIVYGSDRQPYIGRGNLGRPTTAALSKVPPLRPVSASLDTS
jgi:hypothetical protein